jgi:hypothetical protein
MENSLRHKPAFTLHRSEPQGDRPLVIDTTDLTDLYQGDPLAGPPNITPRKNQAIPCRRWKSVRVFVVLEGGVTPTIDLVPLEVVSGEDAFAGATDADRGFAIMGSATGALSSGESIVVDVYGATLFLRVSALTGLPTALKVFVAGEETMPSLTGQE